jgi:type IV pilus assembly protein PilC
MFAAFAESERGRGAWRFARQMREAQTALVSGNSLTSALANLPQIPQRILDLIGAAERVGRLPQVLARLMKQRRDAIARGALIPPFYRTYPLVVGAALLGVTSMVLVFVMPKFEAIFRDFGTKLPAPTVLLLDTANALSPWILLIIPLMVIFAFISVIRYSTWRQIGIIESPGAWIANRLPWVGRVRMHGALGDVLQFAADAVEAGWPADRAIAEAALIPANSKLRETLDYWVQGIARGQSMADAARDAGLPAILSTMLSTAITTQDVAEVLRFVGRYFSMRFSRGLAIARAALVPSFAIIMGSFVAWVALSVIVPMVTLIDSIARAIPGGH